MAYQAPAQPEGAKPAAAETAQVVVPDGLAPYGQRESTALVTPTQVRRPWRSTVRTAFQALLALAILTPVLVQEAGLDPSSIPWLGTVVALAATFAKIMANAQVEAFLRRFLPFLSAAPNQQK